MALCSRCGGGFNFYPLLKRAPVPPVEADPFCPICGQRRHVTCRTCDGSGFILSSGHLLRGYCTSCGAPMQVKARTRCPDCRGNGHATHNCAGHLWPEGAYRSLAERPAVTLVAHSHSRALLRRHA